MSSLSTEAKSPFIPSGSSGNLERNAARRHDVQNLFGELIAREAGADGAGDFPVVLRAVDFLRFRRPDMADIPGRNTPSHGVVLADIARQPRSVVHDQKDIRNSLSRNDLLSDNEGPTSQLQPVRSTRNCSGPSAARMQC